MEFNNSSKDITKRQEFHNPHFAKKQLRIKKSTQAELIKALDDLTETVCSNSDRIKELQGLIKNSIIEEDKKQLFEEGIHLYNLLSALSKKVSEIYVMLLDIYTYGTYCLLATDEWDWRAFARHLYTIIYEHTKTVNRQLNDIVRILKTQVGKGYDFTSIICAKRQYTLFIEGNSAYAKLIRVKVDAHFDGNYIERLDLISNLSYSSIIELYYGYIGKMQAFLKEVRPVLIQLRHSADMIYHSRRT